MFMLTDSSKRRSSMRAKCSKEKAEIVSAVEELNSISSLCGLPPTNTEDVMSGVFSWSFNESETALLGILQVQQPFIVLMLYNIMFSALCPRAIHMTLSCLFTLYRSSNTY